MGSTDAKKAKKKKSRKVGRTLAASLSVPQTPLSTLDSEEIEQMTQLMDADDVNEVIVPAFSQAPNPFLSGHQCLLCRCDRPHLPKQNGDATAGEEGSDSSSSISQLPPWVCHECRKTVEEEEKRTEVPMSALLEPDLRLEPPVLPLLSELGGSEPVTENGTLCQCKACTERRHIEAEQEREAQGLLHCWTELRHIINCVYQRALTPTSSDDGGSVAVSTADIEKAKEFVHRLCVRDPHKLFQRVDEQGQEYVLEVKKRLLQQLASGSKTSAQHAKLFLSILLDEYANLCSTAKTLAFILAELEQLHLKQFHITCELHSKHLFHALIYMEEDLQNRLHMLIPQLSLGSTGNEEVQDSTTSDLLQRYMKFDNEMSVVSVVWRECQQFIERYNDEQAVLTAKRKMLKEDWEFFKQQRKLLQQQQQQQQEEETKCSAASPSSSPHTVELVEAQFTHMMERILQGAKPTTNEYHCPNCNRKRCPCDECSISHMITCGIINPDLLDQLHQHGAAEGGSSCMAAQVKFPNELYTTLNVRPPSMSSTCSSSGSESPIIIDPERLTLPFDEDTLDLGEDDLDEDEDSRSGNSDNESTADEDDTQQRRLDCAAVTTTSDVDRAARTMDKLDGIEHRASDLERAVSYAASLQVSNNSTFSCGFTQQPHSISTCECISCIFQPEAQQVRVTEESQCQCHACLQQQRQKQQQQQQHGVATEMTLPQHFPVLPQPGNQALHLYPHIHGPNIMHPIVAAAAAVTTLQPTQLAGQHPHPLLQPQLYELHSPLPQQQLVLKAVTSSCVSATTATPTSHTHQQQLNHFGHYVDDKDVRLAVSNDKLYHACLGWENATVNGAHLMLSSQFNLPPSPPFANDIPLVTHSSTAMTLPEDQFASVVPTSAAPLFQQCTLATAPSTSSTSRLGGTQCGASVVFSAPVSSLDPRVPDTHAASVKRTLLNPGSQTVPIHNFTPVIGSSLPGTGDMCMKHNPFMYMTNHSSLTSTPHTTTISTSQPTAAAADAMKLNDDLMRSSGVTGAGCCDSIASMSHQDQMYALAHSRMQATGGTTKQMVNVSHVTRMQQQGCTATPQGVPAPRGAPPNHHHTHGVSMTAAGHVDVNNVSNSDVSSTAGSMCLEADSCAHNDDNCDSNDDSCSEQSSSTSTSNQKDGKYCDCCYCEFFGHSTPPTLPTSRNYAEMRDRLRLRLKQRNEARTEKDKETLTPASPPKNEIVDQRELDELLRFINGAKDDAALPVEVVMPQTPTDNKATAKAAKRARQKQRKADEKAKKEAEEERQAKLERLRQLEQERAYQQLLKKKRSRHKEQQKAEAATQVPTPTSSSVANGDTPPGNKLRTVTVVTQAVQLEKPRQSFATAITTNGQFRLSSPGVTTSWAPSSCQASVKKSCQSVASAEYKPLRSNDCTAAPCTTSQQPVKLRRQQPQQVDRAKKVANKHQLQPGGISSSSSNNVENGSPKRTPSLKVKRSGDASDVHAQNRRNEQTSHTAQTIGRSQQCSQAKVARQNCVAGSNAHKSSALSNGPVTSKSCTAANCVSDTGHGGNTKNHHVASKEQTACLAHFMQQHQIGLFNTGPPAKTCHNTTDTTPSHQPANSVGRKKGYKVYQEQGSHHPLTHQPTPSVTPRSGRPAMCSNSHVDQRMDTGQSGHSSLANNHAPVSVSSPLGFENHAWKLDKKAVTHKQQQPVTATASRSKCDLEKSPRTNDQNSGSINKNKKNRRKKATEDLSSLDEIFLPKEDVENGELDEFEREIEEFKRFCLDSTPAEKREKVQVTMNMKDIFSKKKSGLLA